MRSARTAVQREIEERLKEAQIDGLGEASMGLTWVVIGSYLSAGSMELAAFFG